MERTISSEERIRRAEEIYARRKQANGIRVKANTVNNTKDFSLFKKMFLQIAICLVIYGIFYLIKNTNYIFSEGVIEQTKSFLSYDINFEKYYIQVVEFYNNNVKKILFNNIEMEKNKEENKNSTNANKGELKNENETEEKSINLTEETNGIGGGESEEIQEEVAGDISKIENNDVETGDGNDDNDNQLTQMEVDANDIKNNYSLIVPLDRNC